MCGRLPFLLALLFFAFTGPLPAAATKSGAEVLPTEENLQQAQHEIAILDTHIQATEASLERQQKLRALLIEYKQIESACITNPNDTQLLFKLAKAGKDLQESIENNCLTEYFPAEFIRELHKLKQIADKKSIPPAK